MTSAFFWQNSISLFPVSFCTSRPNLPITSDISWLLTIAFQCPMMKRTSFCGVSSTRSCRSSWNHSTSASSAFVVGHHRANQANDPRTAEQLYQWNSLTVKKPLGPTADFPTCDPAKELRIPRKFDFGGQWDLITEHPQDWGNRLSECTNKTLCAPGARSIVPRRDWVRLACECPGISGGGVVDSLASGQTSGREHSSSHQQKIRLKIYWTWTHPSEQDPVSPTVRLSHEEACMSLLYLFIRRQTEWKPQS